MLIGLAIRDVVLIESLDLAFGPGLTVLTGETGAGKSIILDALGLATGARGDAGLVRHGAAQAQATAIFTLAGDHPAWAYLAEKGLAEAPDDDLVLRRQLSADGRSRAFVNDQPTSIGVLRDLGGMLLEVHGQHETVGLLDSRTHRSLLDVSGGLKAEAAAALETWSGWRAARERVEQLAEAALGAAAEADELTARLAELDRLAPLEGEEAELAERRALLGAAEKALAEINAAREGLSDNLLGRIAQALRALERGRERALAAGVSAEGAAGSKLAEAAAAVDRALVEATEASAAVDFAAQAFEFEPDELERTEERLFALRAAARKLGVSVEELPARRAAIAETLRLAETSQDALAAAEAKATEARERYRAAAGALSAARRAAGDRLAAAVAAELAPLKLEKARFRVAVEPLPEERAGPSGADRVAFEIATIPGAPFAPLSDIASGGELARFALALKATLADHGGGAQPLMIFDEVDQGVGGAVADAVGLRLKRLAASAQVVVVTHSPQVAARADAHWRVLKRGDADRVAAAVETLNDAEREEEIARMLSGAATTDAARAAARALMTG